MNPARYCGVCRQCRSGRGNLCTNVYFFGSASRFPHVQGGFAEFFVAAEAQCVRLTTEISFPEVACAEPLAVVLHATNQAGNLNSKRVLITGAGPIGLLAGWLPVLRGRSKSPSLIEFASPLKLAMELGLDYALNVAENPDALKQAVSERGEFDVALEASGAVPSDGELPRITWTRWPTWFRLACSPLPNSRFGRIIAKEIEVVGTFRFFQEYADAVRPLRTRQD